MMKLLLLAGVIAAVYFLFFKKKSVTSSSDSSMEEAMVPCERCGTYVQMKEALMRDGKYYCSRECLEGRG